VIVVEAQVVVDHAGCCSLLHEMFGKEETAAMMVVDFQQQSRAVLCLFGAGPGLEAYSSHRNENPPRPDGSLSSLVVGAAVGKKRECAQCAHPGRWTGSYWCRTGPDSGCFRGSGGNPRAGTRFEPYLGHSVSAGQGHFLGIFVCTLCTLPPLI
jgi:hypothetical protein